MKIYTSYFKNADYLRSHDIIPVGICRFPPDKFKDTNIYLVAPSTELLMKYKNDHDKNYYYGTYMCQLRNINFDTMCKAFEKISKDNNGKDIALCCFEMPDEFCHRHLLAEFLNSYKLFGGDIHEFTAKDLLSDEPNSLF